ncbi:MAG: prepilin-type N-terminal cleavage/methylation domain-containing protein [Halieaceae bacterium]|nr:prepilin-type N-terminal cleavage/methylation domain-containing protein [Halieaceae bacterium]
MRASEFPMDGGYTLVEIMIALALGAILLAGSLEIYSTSRASWADQRLGAVIVENGRVTSQVIRSSFTRAGYYGCVPGRDNLHLDKTSGLTLHPYIHISPAADGESLGLEKSATSDIATVYDGDNDSMVYLTGAHTLNGGAAASRRIALDAVPAFSAGDIVVISDCVTATALEVESVSGSSLTYSATSCGTNISGCSYGENASIMKLNIRRFFIAENGRGGESLYIALGTGSGAIETELVEGVSNVTMYIGLDAETIESGGSSSGSDGSIDRYVRPSSGETWESAVGDWSDTLAIRIDYTIASQGQETLASDFSTVAMVRNFRMN